MSSKSQVFLKRLYGLLFLVENLILCAMEKLKHSAMILSRSEIGKAQIYFHILTIHSSAYLKHMQHSLASLSGTLSFVPHSAF